MHIRKAGLSDAETVKSIVHTTISAIYPHYYPKGAVDFFLAHHNGEAIVQDIKLDRVFVCCDAQQRIVGTVTIKENHINRLFVLPDLQGNGYGTALLAYAEKSIAAHYGVILLDASFPAKSIYLRHGYKELTFHTIRTSNGDHLCYDVMQKNV